MPLPLSDKLTRFDVYLHHKYVAPEVVSVDARDEEEAVVLAINSPQYREKYGMQRPMEIDAIKHLPSTWRF